MPASSFGAEVKQLMTKGPSKGPRKGQPYPQKQALAASYSMRRRGAFKKSRGRKV
jgi:hypothetical protein